MKSLPLSTFLELLCTIGLLAAGGENKAANEDNRAAKPASTLTATTPRNEQWEAESGPLFRASALRGKSVQSTDGAIVGKVDDLVFDLDAGKLALLVVATEKPLADGAARVAAPSTAFEDLGAAKILKLRVGFDRLRATPALTAAIEKGELTRQQVQAIHGDLAVDFYETPEKEHADAPCSCVGVLGDMAVHNAKGAKLGRIEDFAITPRGSIAYAGLASNEQRDVLYPVPLSAFVVSSDSKEWVLELPADILENTPKFNRAQWPRTLDRGWIEYVHVRFGRSPLGGVQRELNARKAQEPATRR